MSAVTGNKEVKQALRKYAKRAPSALGAALYQEALAIMRESQREVPVDEGRLRNTGYVAPPRGPDQDPSVEIGYGTKYALKQHEDRSLNHPGQGKAGYLSDPVDRARSGYAGRIARRTQSNIDKNRGLSSVRSKYPKEPKE